MNRQLDVAIVGAGPIGLAAAGASAEAGAQTLVVEKKPEGAAPSCCTGLVSPRTLSTLRVSDSSVLQTIRALRIHIPGIRPIDLRSDQIKAVTIDRNLLEQELLMHARQAGATVRFNVEAVDAEDGLLHVQSSRAVQPLRTTVIIGADGPRSRVASWFSLEQSAQVIAAAQVELEASAEQQDRVDVFFGNDIAPGFFGWSVPAASGILRVGLGVLPPQTPMAFLDRLVAQQYPASRVLSRTAGWIPLAPPPKIAAPGVLLVGDAAGHVKPLSGGGLYTGGTCARVAGEIAAAIAASKNRDVGSKDSTDILAASYVTQCQEALGKEQAFGQAIRSHMSELADEDMGAVADALNDPQLLQFLADQADIDFFHQLPDRLASEPRLWGTLLRIIPLLGALAN